MEKIREQLKYKQQRLDYLEQCNEQHQEHIHQLYSEVVTWIETYLLHTTPPREIYLSFDSNTSLIIRFAWEEMKHPQKIKVLLTIFDVDAPKKRTLCWLYWQEHRKQWRIKSLKRKHHCLKSFFFRRSWSKKSLENCLIDFICVTQNLG